MEELIIRLQAFRDQRDWKQFHTPKDLAISVSIEAGELLELFQWQPADSPFDQESVGKVAAEAADVFIYLTLLSERLGFNLVDAANKKIDENERRFPAAQSFRVPKPEDVLVEGSHTEDC